MGVFDGAAAPQGALWLAIVSDLYARPPVEAVFFLEKPAEANDEAFLAVVLEVGCSQQIPDQSLVLLPPHHCPLLCQSPNLLSYLLQIHPHSRHFDRDGCLQHQTSSGCPRIRSDF